MNRRKLAEFEQGILHGQVALQDSARRIRELQVAIRDAKARLRITTGADRVYGASADTRTTAICEADIAKWTPELEVAQAAHDALAERLMGRRVLAEACRKYAAEHTLRPEPRPYVPSTQTRLPGTPAPVAAHMENSAAAIRASLSDASGPPRLAASATPTRRT